MTDEKKPLVRHGQTGEAFFIRLDSAWWQVAEGTDPNDDNAWRQGNLGSYAPFSDVLAGQDKAFPDITVPNGTIVRCTVTVEALPKDVVA